MNLRLRLVQVTSEAVSVWLFNIIIWLQGFESEVCVCVCVMGRGGGWFSPKCKMSRNVMSLPCRHS